MIYDELPSAWRFVDDTAKLSSERPCGTCDKEQEFSIFTDTQYLPPFIWRGPLANFFNVSGFILEDKSGFQIDLSAYIVSVPTLADANYVYVYFEGMAFPTSTPLQSGIWQAQISDGIHTLYSEPINICDSIEKCVKLSWRNSCDLSGFPYSQVDTFQHVIFLNESQMLSPEYETEIEESENIYRQVDKIFQSQGRTMRFKTDGPDWIVKMFQAMQLHDEITIAYGVNDAHPEGLYYASIEKLTVGTTELPSECTTEIEVKFLQDDSIVSTACCVPGTYTQCIEKCANVQGFVSDFMSYQDGELYIDDIDSPVIYEWDGDSFELYDTECFYVLNLTTGQFMYFDGDQWNQAPRIDSVTLVGIDGVTGIATYEIVGYTIPGTWVYLSYVDPPVFDFAMPITAAQLAAGYNFQVPPGAGTLHVRIKAESHGCKYGTTEDFVV